MGCLMNLDLDMPPSLPHKHTNVLITQILGVVFTFAFFTSHTYFFPLEHFQTPFLDSHCYCPFGRIWLPPPHPAVGHRANNQTASLLLLLSFLHFAGFSPFVVASPCYLCKLRIYNITFKFSILAFKTPDKLAPSYHPTAPTQHHPVTPPLCCSHHQQSQHIPCPQRLLHRWLLKCPSSLLRWVIYSTAVIATTVHWRLSA